MPKTIETGALQEGKSKERQLFDVVNKVRASLNETYRTKVPVVTAATNVLTPLWTSPTIPEGALWKVHAEMEGRAIAGGAAVASYDLIGIFYREVGGSITQEGATVSLYTAIETVAAMASDLAISGETVLARVRDDGVRTMSWTARVQVLESA